MLSELIHSKVCRLVGLVLLYEATSCDYSAAQNRIVGYYAGYNSSLLPYTSVEYSNLTHIIVAFAMPNSNGTLSYDDPGIPFPGLVTNAHSAGTKVLISLGGASGGTAFPVVTADSASRSNFINNIVSFLDTNRYDGVDIDWETPSDSQETAQLTTFVSQMRERFKQVDSSWLITMAIPAGPWGGQHFDIRGLVGNIDWFNVMCYDFVGSWSAYSGHDSPLYQSPSDPNQAGSDSTSIIYWSGRGTRTNPILKNKLVLGVPFYAVRFNSIGLYQSLANTTTTNPYYPEIAGDIVSGWTYHWDDVSKVPYLTNQTNTSFITYEDTNSIRLKTEYCLRQQLGGIMIWELSQDVYNGHQPLLETIASTMRNATAVEDHPYVAVGYGLFQNYPNPFNPSTTISFQIPVGGFVSLRVYDVLGRLVRVLADGWMSAGRHQVAFDASTLAGGVYLYRIAADDFSRTAKMIFIK